jgi:hypothetical protein
MSYDRSDTPTLEDVISNAIRKVMLDFRVSIPVKVLKYDSENQKVDIQPLIRKKYKTQDRTGQVVDSPVISDVPIEWPSSDSGNAYMTFPLKVGDLGRAEFMDRSIAEWLSGNGSMVTPEDPRIHNISDAVFVPGLRPFGSKLSDVSTVDVVIKNGNLKLSIDPDGKISISNGSDDLTSLIKDLSNEASNHTTVTAIGIQPVLNKAAVATLKSKIEAFVK